MAGVHADDVALVDASAYFLHVYVADVVDDAGAIGVECGVAVVCRTSSVY